MKKPYINIKEIKAKLEEVKSKLTPEEKEILKEVSRKANECIKNDDLKGLESLRKEYSK